LKASERIVTGSEFGFTTQENPGWELVSDSRQRQRVRAIIDQMRRAKMVADGNTDDGLSSQAS
jgi:hypothetical protein